MKRTLLCLFAAFAITAFSPESPYARRHIAHAARPVDGTGQPADRSASPTKKDKDDVKRGAVVRSALAGMPPKKETLPSLLEPLPPGQIPPHFWQDELRRVAAQSGLIRTRLVRVRRHVLRLGRTVDIEIFDGRSVSVSLFKRSRVLRSEVISGRIKGTGESVAFATMGASTYAEINSSAGCFELAPLDGDVHALRELDPQFSLPCALIPRHAALAADERPDAETLPAAAAVAARKAHKGQIVTVDWAAVYTPAARLSAGGSDAIEARVASILTSTNDAFEDSESALRLRLVGLQELNYVESGSFETDLHRLTYRDGYADEVHAFRDQVGADVVTLYVDGAGEFAGIAHLLMKTDSFYERLAFNVVWSRAGWSTTAHEIGHNFGCGHDRENAGNPGGLFDYSYGHRFSGDDGVQYRTIMAYSPGRRVGHFSNPDMDYAGAATGVADAADNVRTIEQSAPLVSAYRDSVWHEDSEFIRGDANTDGKQNITDAVFILRYLFTGGETPDCLKAADTNATGHLDLTDAVFLLNYLFLGGPSLEEPFPDCGLGPTIDGLTCGSFPPCEEL